MMILMLSSILACNDSRRAAETSATSTAEALEGRVQGRVLNERGAPLAGARVRLGGDQILSDEGGFILDESISSGELRWSAELEGASTTSELLVKEEGWTYLDIVLVQPERSEMVPDELGGLQGEADGVYVNLPPGAVDASTPELRAALLDDPALALALPALGELSGGGRLRLLAAAEVAIIEGDDELGLSAPATLGLPLLADVTGDEHLYGYNPVSGVWEDLGSVWVEEGVAWAEVEHFSWYGVGAPLVEDQCVRLTLKTSAGRVLSGQEVLVYDLEALAVGRFETDRFGQVTIPAAAGSTVTLALAYGPYTWSSGPLTLPEAPSDEVGCMELGPRRVSSADVDGDAFPATVYGGPDCADDDPSRNPGAHEVWYDGIDQDCQGDDDQDQDGDRDRALGYGGADCDDEDPDRSSLIPEICDGAGVDEDCDGASDGADPEGPEDGERWYLDEDGDCWGAMSTLSCGDPNDAPELRSDGGCTPERWVLLAGDCQDSSGATPERVYPGAPEDCDADEDYNCDGIFGTGDEDFDGDGAPGCGDEVSDCDDTRADIGPGTTEECDDGEDDDCDGLIDEVEDGPLYVDADMDGFGDLARESWDCGRASLVSDATDCDDADLRAFPGAARLEGSACMADHDGDGYGDALALGAVTPGTDCDDARRAVFPHNPLGELCETPYDDDCNGEEGELGAWDGAIFSEDVDGDGVGDAASAVLACEVPGDGWVEGPDRSEDGDCDDTDPEVFPGAEERCSTEGVDDDCDGLTDEDDAVDLGSWYADLDGDGYGGGGAEVRSCVAPTGYGAGEDCNDADSGVHPGAVEACDGTDVDCDGWDTPLSVASDAAWGAYTSVQEAIDVAEDGDEICIAPGEYVGGADLLGKAITLTGSGAAEDVVLTVEDVGDTQRVITMIGGEGLETVVQHLTILGGLALGEDANGGGMVLLDASPTLKDLVFAYCSADGSGGGVYAEGGEPWLEDVVFVGNTAGENGGGLAFVDAPGTILGASFEQNGAVGSGGGLYLLRSDAQVGQVSLLENSADMEGAAIKMKDTSDAMLWELDLVDNETSEGWGSFSIESDLGSALTDAVIVDSTSYALYPILGINLEDSWTVVDAITLSGQRFDALRIVGGGPTIYDLTVEGEESSNCVILEDTQASLVGGDVSGCRGELAPVEIYGGAVRLEAISVHDSSAEGAGAIWIGGAEVDMSQVEIWSNLGENLSGGIAITSGSVVRMSGMNIYENSCVNSCACAILIETASVENLSGWLERNIGEGCYGTIYAYDADLYVNDLLVRGNTTWKGGALLLEGSSVEMINSIIDVNVVFESGGGISSWDSEVRLRDTLVESNLVTEEGGVGGGLAIVGGSLTLEDVHINSNDSAQYGGGLYLENSDGKFTRVGIEVNSTNSLESSGGGVFLSGGSLEVDEVTIYDNDATIGGGIYLNFIEDDLDLSGALVDSNYAYQGGGASVISGDAVVLGLQLTGNRAADGGGLFVASDFEGWIEGAEIVSNTAGRGGGVYVESNASAWIFNSSVVDNSASDSGGGIYVSGLAGITNSTLSANLSDGAGGALYAEGDFILDLTNTSILGNGASVGGALYLDVTSDYPRIDILNSTLAWNTSADGGDSSVLDVSDVELATVEVTYSHAYANDEDAILSTLDPGHASTHLYTAPLFADTSSSDPLEWDLHPAVGSPLIDAGDPDILDPDGTRSDIGAFGGPDADGR